MTQASTRCTSCSTHIPPTYVILRCWQSFNGLHQNAEAGCDLCTICHQYLTNAFSIDSLRCCVGEVKFYNREDHLSLEYASLGVANLPLFNSTVSTHGFKPTPVLSSSFNVSGQSLVAVREPLFSGYVISGAGNPTSGGYFPIYSASQLPSIEL